MENLSSFFHWRLIPPFCFVCLPRGLTVWWAGTADSGRDAPTARPLGGSGGGDGTRCGRLVEPSLPDARLRRAGASGRAGLCAGRRVIRQRKGFVIATHMRKKSTALAFLRPFPSAHPRFQAAPAAISSAEGAISSRASGDFKRQRRNFKPRQRRFQAAPAAISSAEGAISSRASGDFKPRQRRLQAPKALFTRTASWSRRSRRICRDGRGRPLRSSAESGGRRGESGGRHTPRQVQICAPRRWRFAR